MQKLYVLYDGECALCRRLRDWLYEQTHWIQLELLPAKAEAAKRLFPAFANDGGVEELVVITDQGDYYRGNHAWIMCLYALSDYRDWSYRLAQPLLLPLAKQAFELLSHNRARISKWLAATEVEIAQDLKAVAVPGCALSAERSSIKDYLE